MSIHLVVVSDQEEVLTDNIFEYLGCIKEYSGQAFSFEVESITYLEFTFKYVMHFRLLDQTRQSDRFHVLCLDQYDKNDPDSLHRFGKALQECLIYFMRIAPLTHNDTLDNYTMSNGEKQYQLIQWQTTPKLADEKFIDYRRQQIRVVKDSNND